MRVALYMRVSTRRQSLLPQLHALRAFVQARSAGEDPWRITKVYRERKPGTSPTRRQFRQLMHDAAMNRWDLLLVWKLDRFGRSLIEIVGRVRELTAHGRFFCVATQGGTIDTSSSSGKLQLAVLSAVAEFESELIGERVKNHIAHRRSRGMRWGRPRKMPDPTPVLEMRASGSTVSKIAKSMGCSEKTIQRCLDAHQDELAALVDKKREGGGTPPAAA